MIILATILLFAAVALLVYGIVSPRLESYELFLSRYKRRRSGILLLVTPVLAYIITVIHRRFGEHNAYLERIREKMRHTGVDMPLSADEIVALQVLLAVGGLAGTALLGMVLSPLVGKYHGVALAVPVMVGFAGWMLPLMPIDNIIAARRRLILADWPFFMDLLTLALESGMDITTGIRRIVGYLPMGPLTEELMRFVNAIQLGARRAAAMREMAARIAVAPITATVEMILQAEELGTELGALMRTQSAEFRDKHAQYVEQLAMEAPVKMLMPLLGCIFPAILITLVGPVMIQYSMSQ